MITEITYHLMNSSCVSFILKSICSRKRTTIAGVPRKLIGPIRDGFHNCTNSCCTIHTSPFVGWCIVLFEVRILEIWYTYMPPNYHNLSTLDNMDIAIFKHLFYFLGILNSKRYWKDQMLLKIHVNTPQAVMMYKWQFAGCR